MSADARRENFKYQEQVTLHFDHPQVTATTTWPIFKVPAGRTFRVDGVDYVNFTGLAEDTTNAFAGAVKNGSTTVATLFDTDADEAGTNTLGTAFVAGVLSVTDADAVLAAADVLSLVVTEDGAATLPAGRVVVRGRYV